VTTREWFRVQRGELWRTDASLASTCDGIARAIELHTNPMQGNAWVRFSGSTILVAVEDVPDYLRRQTILDTCRQHMDEAMRQLWNRRMEELNGR
jgi:hypothetical protein